MLRYRVEETGSMGLQLVEQIIFSYHFLTKDTVTFYKQVETYTPNFISGLQIGILRNMQSWVPGVMGNRTQISWLTG